MTCTKTEPKNDLFFNCRTKTKELSKKELSKKELSNVAPASGPFGRKQFLSDDDNSLCEEFVDSLGIFEPIHTRIFVGNVIMLFF